jgi:hydroxyethylthiazole kinase-like uncharacterized protein yjeF
MLTLAPGLALLTPDAMRAAEATAIRGGAPALLLMERAAAAAAKAIASFAPGRPALVLCGPGNNGGDGYGVALLLREMGFSVRVAALAPAVGDPAATMAARWDGAIETLDDAPAAPLIIDALFGTGLTRLLPDKAQAALDRMRNAGSTIVALDIPSGVDAMTGAALGRPLAAHLTIAFGAMKRGHALGQGQALSGRMVVADIGISIPKTETHLVPAPCRLPMPHDTHKYRRGAVLVIEGDPRRGGAASLTALAALRAGAGLVTLVGSGEMAPADAIMRRNDGEGRALLSDPRIAAIAIGPGLMDDQRGRDWVARLLAGTTPLVVDAGAFAVLPGALVPGSGASAGFAEAKAPLVLTPHDGEFARMFGPVGADRVGAALAAAVACGGVVVLKGAETVIASPDGRAAINTHAAPWLATAGSGDVLTGIITALIAQGMTLFDAARAGVWLHGDAGLRGGPGLIADDIPALLPTILAAL